MNEITFNTPTADGIASEMRAETDLSGRGVARAPVHNKLPAIMFRSNLIEMMGTHFLICTEAIKGKGEDCGLEAYTRAAGLMGVFDGCGGLGARRCTKANGKTEAYLASRAIGNAANRWFEVNERTGYNWDVTLLKDMISSSLELCRSAAGETALKLKGSMIRSFPSTMAIVAFSVSNSKLVSKHIWAGDSRTYLLDANGLCQISIDDIHDKDAMSNLTGDGALTNVVAADGKFILHSTELGINHPCIILCATDGCFGYVSSPMEFEMMLLSTLLNAGNVATWEDKLKEAISLRAGDDQTIAVASFGFDTFREMQQYYQERTEQISSIVESFASHSAEGKQQLWNQYKVGYYRYSSLGE